MALATDRARLAKDLLRGAKEFHMAGALCRSKMVIEDPAQWFLQPQMVNYAFASELALKGLHAVHLGAVARGHDLVKLSEPLSITVMDNIRGQIYPKSEFDRGLKASRLAFETWRYSHEHVQLRAHLSFLAKFAVSAIAVLERDIATTRTHLGP